MNRVRMWLQQAVSGGDPPTTPVERGVQQVFEHSPTGMAIAEPDGRLIAVNPALVALLGRSEAVLLGGTLAQLAHPEHAATLNRRFAALVGGRRSTRHETRLLEGDGTPFDALVSAVTVFAPDGEPAHVVLHVEDVSEYLLLVEQMRERALHDPLTGLANRALFADRLQHAFAGYQRNGWPLTLLFIDLDDFKSVNDEHGHAVGDELLVLVARRLAECSRAVDTVARMGGDEFAVLCEHTALDDGLRIAERLADAACRPATIDGHRVAVTASVGVQSACPEVDDPDTLLRRADSAMYENKRLSKLQRSA